MDIWECKRLRCGNLHHGNTTWFPWQQRKTQVRTTELVNGTGLNGRKNSTNSTGRQLIRLRFDVRVVLIWVDVEGHAFSANSRFTTWASNTRTRNGHTHFSTRLHRLFNSWTKQPKRILVPGTDGLSALTMHSLMGKALWL